MRLFRLAWEFGEVIDHANNGINEVRSGVASLVLPLKLLLWGCIVIVAVDALRGSASKSLAYRTVASAIDQLWYAIFYLTLPVLWKRGCERVSACKRRAEWIVVRGWSEDEWAVVDDLPSTTDGGGCGNG